MARKPPAHSSRLVPMPRVAPALAAASLPHHLRFHPWFHPRRTLSRFHDTSRSLVRSTLSFYFALISPLLANACIRRPPSHLRPSHPPPPLHLRLVLPRNALPPRRHITSFCIKARIIDDPSLISSPPCYSLPPFGIPSMLVASSTSCGLHVLYLHT